MGRQARESVRLAATVPNLLLIDLILPGPQVELMAMTLTKITNENRDAVAIRPALVRRIASRSTLIAPARTLTPFCPTTTKSIDIIL